MLLDGEVPVAVSGYDSMLAMMDLIFLLGTASWPENSSELEALFPREEAGFFLRVFRYIKDLV